MFPRPLTYERAFDVLDELRRQMDRAWEDIEDPSVSWPRTTVRDAGEHVIVRAWVPGLTEKDVTLTLHDGVLTIAGERRLTVPEGYVVRRQERAGSRFSRSFALPAKVDGEKATAEVKDGVLTVTIAKAAEAKPRQIAVRTKE
jgi:HSP20 family protein